MLNGKMVGASILLILFLQLESAANTQSFSEVQLSVEGQKAYRTILAAERFEDKAIGYGAVRSKLVEAYCVLLKEPAADAAFKSLLEHATLPGQLYALCGLYFTDPNSFRSAAEKFRHSEERADTLSGCIGGLRAVSTLVESKKPIMIDPNHPEQSLHDHIEANTKAITEWNGSKRKRKNDKPPEGYQLDILNGGYSVWFRCG